MCRLPNHCTLHTVVSSSTLGVIFTQSLANVVLVDYNMAYIDLAVVVQQSSLRHIVPNG